MSDASIRIAIAEALLRPADGPIASGDASAAREVLGRHPQIAWDTTLNEVLQDRRALIAAGEA